MTTDPIAAARALIAAQPDLLFRCDLCPDECNCHPHHDMSMSGEYILCDGCEDFDVPKGVPDPLKLIATLADAVEIERMRAEKWREAAGAHHVAAMREAEKWIAVSVERDGLRAELAKTLLQTGDLKIALDVERKRAEKAETERDEWKDEYQTAARLLNLYRDAAFNRQIERDQALARVAAAYEDACKRVLIPYDVQENDETREVVTWSRRAIRNLTPSDAQAALDKLLTEARLEGWRAGRDAAVRCLEQGADEYSCGCDPIHCRCHHNIEQMRIDAEVVRDLPEPKEAEHD